VGGIVGAVGGGVAVGEATEFVYDHAADIADWWDEGDDELLARLPTEIDESAPPELQHLVEIKRILTEAQSERKSLGYGRTRDSDLQNDRRDLTGKIERIEQMYDEAYDTYEDSGALGTAIASLCDWERAEQVAQQAIENMQRDIPEHEASYGQTSSALAFSK
jgi:rubrerythrin